MVMRSVCLLVACLAVLGSLQAAPGATVTVLKEGTALNSGGALDTAFSSAGTGNVAPQSVNDTYLIGNPAAAWNWYGDSASNSGTLLFKFDLSAIGPGSKIYVAQLRWKATGGNTFGSIARIITHDWTEATATLAGPDRPVSPNKTWGPASNALFSSADYGVTAAIDSTASFWLVKNVTADVQGFIDSTFPNYGWYVGSGNYVIKMSESVDDGDRPALFISWDPNAAPNPVADLAITGTDWFKIDLRWTTPSDMPPGPIHHYDIRMSTSPITDASFDAATTVAAPTPAAPGTIQNLSVTGLSPSTTYYFAIKCYDATGLVSTLSNNGNAVFGTTTPLDVVAPAQVNLQVLPADIYPNHVIVRWTAVGDDGMTGTAAGYDLRYSTSPIFDDASFGAATAVAGLAAPKAPGSAESVTVHGLSPSTTYYFAIKARDEVPNWSVLSNPVAFTTKVADLSAPLAVTNLRVTTGHIHAIYLTWPAPADVGSAGLAGYDVRYSLAPIDDSNWDSATQATGEPTPGATGAAELFAVTGLNPSTTYYFAMKSYDWAEPANVSAISNGVSGVTLPPIQPVTVVNPWVVNDRVADTHNVATMGATYVNAYTPDGVIAGTTEESKAINIYNNQKRRLYHWADEPPNVGGNSITDPTYNQNVFGWCLCGRHADQACTIADAAGLAQRKIGLPGHWIYEVGYSDGTYHAYDTMTTMYVYNKASPASVASCAQMAGDNTILANAVADHRACPGFLLCGDSVSWYQTAVNSWSNAGSSAQTTRWNGNITMRLGQTLSRTWEAWQNQHPSPRTNADSDPGNDPPYHHECQSDWKDTVNYNYWEPYGQTISYVISTKPTYRRWSNGIDTLVPDFRSAGYLAMLETGSANLATFNDDNLSPDLHTLAVGTQGEAIFKVNVPYYITDASISGTFVRNASSDVCKVYFSSTGASWTQVYDAPVGTTAVSNLNLRGSVFGLWQTYYVKVQMKATAAKTDAGVSNLSIQTIFEHNKGSMPYLDKGVNNITVTFDNPAELQASRNVLRLYYKWKEYDGSGWNVDREFDTHVTTSPSTYTINVGGTKVPRTEVMLLQVRDTPVDPYPPYPVADLAAGTAQDVKVPLTWTASGNDGDVGTATSYELRYSTLPITAENFAAATLVSGVPSPKPAGSAESFTVTGLAPDTDYWFALKVHDAANTSDLSNVVMAHTALPDTVPPLWVGNLVATASKAAGGADLSWKAPADYGVAGAGPYTSASYQLRYSTSPIAWNDGGASWNAATAVAGVPAPKAPGQAETFTVTGLTGGTTYYFALRSVDSSGNVSEVSNCASCKAARLGERTLQGGVSGYVGVRDSYIYGGGTSTNYGTNERMTVCGWLDQGIVNVQRGLVRFDLSGLPAGTSLTKATLSLYSYDAVQSKGSSGFYGVYPLSRDWTESGVTWNSTGSTNWTTAGGDFASTPDATSPKQPGAAPCWYSWDVRGRVQAWLAAPSTNFGWIVCVTDENLHNQERFYQSDTSNAPYRPKLLVSDLPEAVAGDINGDGGVDVVDLLTLVDSFGAVCGQDRNYDPLCDFNADGGVDVVDLLYLIDYWPQ